MPAVGIWRPRCAGRCPAVHMATAWRPAPPRSLRTVPSHLPLVTPRCRFQGPSKAGVMAAQGFFPPTRYYSIDVECVASGTGPSLITLREQRSRTGMCAACGCSEQPRNSTSWCLNETCWIGKNSAGAPLRRCSPPRCRRLPGRPPPRAGRPPAAAPHACRPQLARGGPDLAGGRARAGAVQPVCAP